MSPCQTCHAGCCRSFAVPVTGADILRIERDLGLCFWDFACRWADPHDIIARNSAPHFHFSDEPQTRFVICLMHAKSEFLSGTTKCRFLTEGAPDAEHPIGMARCGIYASRPATCRTFPTKLNDTGDLTIIHDVPERGRTQDHPAYHLCPRQWEPSDLDPLDSMQNLVVARSEMIFFTQVSQVWNLCPRPWSLFPEFLRLVYARRVVREAVAEDEVVEDEAPATIKFPTVDRTSTSKAA